MSGYKFYTLNPILNHQLNMLSGLFGIFPTSEFNGKEFSTSMQNFTQSLDRFNQKLIFAGCVFAAITMVFSISLLVYTEYNMPLNKER